MQRLPPVYVVRRTEPLSRPPPVEHPSRSASERYLHELREALSAVDRGWTPEPRCLVWPEGLDRSVLSLLPLAVRTRNALSLGGLAEGSNALSAQDVLVLQNFGKKSLVDLVSCLEQFLLECIRKGNDDPADPPTPVNEIVAPEPRLSRPEDPAPSPPWVRAGEVLAPVIASGAEVLGTHSLASILHPDLLRLATRMGMSSELEAVPIRELVDGTTGLASRAFERLSKRLEELSVPERAIVEQRLLRVPPKTLEEVGSQVGLTRERIRQIQHRLEQKVQTALGKPMSVLAATLKEPCGSLVAENELEDRIWDLLPSPNSLPARLFRSALIERMGYSLADGVYYDARVHEFVEQLVSFARQIADDVGLVDEQKLVGRLPHPRWQPFWPWLRGRCGFHILFGKLGLRAGDKARAKAALLFIGRPATRAEIGRLCGIEEARVGAHLSNVPSVVRADKERWGLTGWVDDEYDGIVGEIVQRIEEDGGATTTERLLSELPSKFDVSPNSVRAFMQAPKFEIRDGWISLAKPSSLRLRTLDDVIDGRSTAGEPYWSFPVEARYLEGYSLAGVPPELAKELGCEPDGKLQVRIENISGSRELSLSWRLSSNVGASVGYLAHPLEWLGLRPGQRARITIKGPALVALTADDRRVDAHSSDDADAKLAEIMNRRRAL